MNNILYKKNGYFRTTRPRIFQPLPDVPVKPIGKPLPGVQIISGGIQVAREIFFKSKIKQVSPISNISYENLGSFSYFQSSLSTTRFSPRIWIRSTDRQSTANRLAQFCTKEVIGRKDEDKMPRTKPTNQRPPTQHMKKDDLLGGGIES